MLKTLNINNIAIIEKAEIEFSNGLNVLTGETGAGKSIIIDSINAILGERTSRELVRHGADNANVTAFFDSISSVVLDKLNDYDIPVEEDKTLLISRKISSEGKSVCKVNGSTVTATMLREIARLLINIHGQHDSQTLLNPDYHYKFIDVISKNNVPFEDYSKSFKEFISIRKKLKALATDEDTKDRQLELLNYQIDEIESSNIKIGEKAELLAKRLAVQNNEAITKSIKESIYSLLGDEEFAGVLNILRTSALGIDLLCEVDQDLKVISSEFNDLLEKCNSVLDLLKSKQNILNYNEDDLNLIEERLDLIYKLSTKYGENEEEILNYLEKSVQKRNSIVNSDKELEEISGKYDKCLELVLEKSKLLNAQRLKTAKEFENNVKKQLEFLDMPNVEFFVDFKQGKLSSNGSDKIEFLISTNPGEPAKALSKIASGGELSRIMLAVKNIIAHNDTVSTLIFDEIDTGVSGRASEKIGMKLKSVSKECQVLCVTHSAQIAALADNHLFIEKDILDGKTYTKVSSLNNESRVLELARIMGGSQISKNLQESAKEMLLNSRNNN